MTESIDNFVFHAQQDVNVAKVAFIPHVKTVKCYVYRAQKKKKIRGRLRLRLRLRWQNLLKLPICLAHAITTRRTVGRRGSLRRAPIGWPIENSESNRKIASSLENGGAEHLGAKSQRNHDAGDFAENILIFRLESTNLWGFAQFSLVLPLL